MICPSVNPAYAPTRGPNPRTLPRVSITLGEVCRRLPPGITRPALAVEGDLLGRFWAKWACGRSGPRRRDAGVRLGTASEMASRVLRSRDLLSGPWRPRDR